MSTNIKQERRFNPAKRDPVITGSSAAVLVKTSEQVLKQ
jgi:hypothetical protein